MTHLGGDSGSFSLEMINKSWYFVQLSYLRQETWWWYPFWVYQSIWPILVAFWREPKAPELKSTKSWKWLQTSYFRRETWWWYLFMLSYYILPYLSNVGVKREVKIVSQNGFQNGVACFPTYLSNLSEGLADSWNFILGLSWF